MALRLGDKLIFLLLITAGLLLSISLLFFQHGNVVAFYLLAFIMILSAIGVLFFKNLVHSTFLLALTFMCIGGLFVLLNAGFLAVAQILIYAGAIVILMVFGVMLTKRDHTDQLLHSLEYHILTVAVVGCGLFTLFFRAFPKTVWHLAGTMTSPMENTALKIGQRFFDHYLLPFEIASVLLLMALIGAIVISKKEEVTS